MKIDYLKPSDLIPYSKNAKRHPAEQVRLIANSIKEFGFQQPIVVDKNNVVVIGHGRLLAAKRLKLSEVPVVKADELTEDQIKALRLADNSVAESEWNMDFLKEEIAEIELDMSDFGLDLSDNEEPGDGDNEDDEEDFIDDTPAAVRHNVFENQERYQFAMNNYYGIPEMFPTKTVGDQMWRFCDWAEIPDPENYIAHFYYDDFKFIQAWRDPDKYIDKLRRFKAVVSPDFSLYTDFPRALQILSCYRRQWVGAYWQRQGLDVIPDVVWGDEQSFDYCFEGIPKNSTVAVSTVGVKADKFWNGEDGELFRLGYAEMLKRLEPSTILFYGDMIEGLEGNIIRCPSYYEQKRQLLNKQKDIKEKNYDKT
jgi:hypothetical protein